MKPSTARSRPSVVRVRAVAAQAPARESATERRWSTAARSSVMGPTPRWLPVRTRRYRRGRASSYRWRSAVASARCVVVRRGARRLPDPDVPIGEPLRLPDGRACLRLIDRVSGGVERRVPMRRGRHDEDARLAQRDLAEPMDDREPRDAEARLDLVTDLAENVERHLLERLVLETLD